MPVEIFEMVIRANIGEKKGKENSGKMTKKKKHKDNCEQEVADQIKSLMNRKNER